MSAISATSSQATPHESSLPVFQVVEPDTTYRTCKRCLQRLPISDFRRRTPDGRYRHFTCNFCRREVERARNRAWRQKVNRTKARELMAKVRQARTDRAVTVAATTMLQCFGGVEGFAKVFHDYMVYARHEARRYGRHGALGKAAMCVARLWMHADSRRAESLAAESDEGLHVRLLDAAHELVAARPEALADLLRAHGYEVTRRENTCASEPCDMLS